MISHLPVNLPLLQPVSPLTPFKCHGFSFFFKVSSISTSSRHSLSSVSVLKGVLLLQRIFPLYYAGFQSKVSHGGWCEGAIAKLSRDQSRRDRFGTRASGRGFRRAENFTIWADNCGC
uniref:Uncharacterized protein n=1 Tax=Opuntia streptacantha TaxID=393608 RepID=A0A7C9AQQ5_OPUST